MSRHKITLLLTAILLLASCGVQREVAYISDAERDSAQYILSTFSSTIHPGDQLYIYVNSQTLESVIPFNEETNKQTHLNGGGAAPAVDGYMVSQEGTIIFPVVGVIPVAGMTYDSLARDIESRLIDGGFVNDPVVTVSLMNFRVAVVGEVKRPRELHVPGERLTIFEALALCGDITMDGRRDNISVIRQASPQTSPEGMGTTVVGQIDLTSKEIFNSPYYYLKSGDIVYIEPIDKKKRLASRNTEIPSYVSLAVSAAHLIQRFFNIIRAEARYQ